MHPEAFDFVRRQLGQLAVLEFGSLNVNGTVRDLFPHWNHLGVDLRPGPGVDVVADAGAFDTPQRFDVVVSCEAFEHAANWPAIVANAFRLLKPGGLFVGTAAGPGRAAHKCDGTPLTDGSEHYANVTPAELRPQLAVVGFVEVHVELRGTDVRWCGRKPGGE